MLLKSRIQPVGFQITVFVLDTASGIDYRAKHFDLTLGLTRYLKDLQVDEMIHYSFLRKQRKGPSDLLLHFF